MKKLLMTSALALVGLSGVAQAQSVLERVLGKIDNASNLASVNGTFANIAENIGGASQVTVYTKDGAVLTEAEYAALQNTPYQGDYTAALSTAAAQFWVNPTTGAYISNAEYSALSAAAKAAYIDAWNGTASYRVSAAGKIISPVAYGLLPAVDPAAGYTSDTVAVAGLAGVNGSITNLVDGIDQATQQAIASAGVNAIEWDMPTLNFGDMATTALGAVNTGTITLGVNSKVDEAKTSSTQAVSSVMDQMGGSADTGALVLNIASNMTGVNGSITNTMSEVNGTVGKASTTALGAVNTGTITSGVNAAVQGIVGTSGSKGSTGTSGSSGS